MNRESERQRLVELLKKTPLCNRDFELQYSDGTIEIFADYLLDNGVIVPPCKVGAKVFFVHEICDESGDEHLDIDTGEVISLSLQKEGIWLYCRYETGLTFWHKVEKELGVEFFFTREEALAKLKGGGEG